MKVLPYIDPIDNKRSTTCYLLERTQYLRYLFFHQSLLPFFLIPTVKISVFYVGYLTSQRANDLFFILIYYISKGKKIYKT